MLDEEKLLQEFAVEGQYHIEKIEATLLAMEKGQEDSSLINILFRAAHSIKGTAGFFGLHKVVELSHSMETLLSKVRSNEMSIDSKMIDVLLKANDKLGMMFEKLADSEQIDITFQLQTLDQFYSTAHYKENNANNDSLMGGSKESLHDRIMKSDSSEKYKVMIIALLQRGHKIYNLALNSDKGVADKNDIQTEITQKITSVGNLISCYRATEKKQLVFLFSTVLAKELVIMNLDVQDADIIQLEENLEERELFNILLAGERGEEERGQSLLVSKEVNHVEDSEKTHIKTDKKEESIRVNLALLNNLVNLSGEMVLARNRLIRIIDPYREGIPGMNAVLQSIDDITTQLQQKIMRSRMQTLASLFNVMPRFVRELAKSMDKNMNLSIEGKDVEMDKSIIEGLSDPLNHLLRNALDHGIEISGVRQKTGKPAIAEVLIKAYHEGGRVVIDIIDDGAGIDLGKVKATAIKRGLISSEQIVYTSQQELLNMIFLPGFSTAAGVSDISGRGVGLDVAKANIEKLGGTIEVYTVSGKGTTFRLILPLTLAIIPSLIIEVASQIFAVPQVNVQEILRIIPGQFEKIQRIQGHHVLKLRDQLVPIIHLAEIMGLPIEPKDRNSIIRVLILRKKAKVFGLIVDDIHDQEEILIKPMPRHLKGTKGYSGLTILGDGKVAMVLDTESIGTEGKLILAEEHIEGLSAEKAGIGTTGEIQELLLFKCSGPEIFALSIGMIARVEKLDARNIQVIGDQEYMNFHGNALRLIRLADFVPVSKGQSLGKKLYVIIPKMTTHPMGIIIEEIQDTVQAEIDIDEEEFKSNGFFGSAILNDRIVLLLNLHEVFDMADPKTFASDHQGRKKNQEKIILLIEDTTFFRQMVKQYLQWAGYQVLIAINGREALGILRQQRVDVVLSDIQMPIMDGITLVNTIRADEQLKKLPMVALTSSVMSKEQAIVLMEAGFDAWKCKFDRTHLLEEIASMAQKKGGNPL